MLQQSHLSEGLLTLGIPQGEKGDTGTVQDGSITYNKLHSELKDEITINKMRVLVPYKNTTSASGNTGDCTLLQCGDKNVIVDFGVSAQYSHLKASIQSFGITKFDYAVISHYHGDHVGALESILSDSAFDFSECMFFIPPTDLDYSAMVGYDLSTSADGMTPSQYESKQEECIALIEQYAAGYQVPTKDQIVELGEEFKVKFFNNDIPTLSNYYDIVMHNGHAKEVCVMNNFSLCAQFYNGKTSILFSGDIEIDAQEDAYLSITDSPTIYKIEHHGLNHYASENWLRRISPQYVLIEGTEHADREYSDSLSSFNQSGAVFIVEARNKSSELVSDGNDFILKEFKGIRGYVQDYFAINTDSDVVTQIDALLDEYASVSGYIPYSDDVSVSGMPFASGAFYRALGNTVNARYIEVIRRDSSNMVRFLNLKINGTWTGWKDITQPTRKKYSFTPTQNQYISPFSYYGEVSIANDLAEYGDVMAVVVQGASTAPTLAMVNGTNLRIYSSQSTAVDVFITYGRSINI